MKIRSLEVDIDKGILKINGKNVEDPMMVTLPGPCEWPLKRLFNPEKVDQKGFTKIAVTQLVVSLDEAGSMKEERQMEEKILKICTKLFWPVLIAWILCVLVKIMVDFGLIT